MGAAASPDPLRSRTRATLSPLAGVGAKERSTTPKGTCSRRDASCATSWPIRVMLEGGLLDRLGQNVKGVGALDILPAR